MGANSKIEWCDHTFNPWVGCTKVSPGCDHCYAETWAKRAGTPQLWDGQRRRTSVDNWKLPLRWNAEAQHLGERKRVFCASLADVFDNLVSSHWRWDLFSLIRHTPHLDWLLLTKRIGNALEMMNSASDAALDCIPGTRSWEREPWPNVWIGSTVVDQDEADRDIPKLARVPAAVRFLSCEPLLRRVDPSALAAIHWVIAGGESGGHARPMHVDWARGMRDQCETAGIPFFFKQWGEWLPADQVTDSTVLRKCVAAIYNHDHWDVADADVIDSDSMTHDELVSRGVHFRVGRQESGNHLDRQLHQHFPGSP